MIKLKYPEFWNTRNMIACILWPLSIIYLLSGIIRQFITSPINLPAKVICVGNATVGGTGKTQLVIWLAQLFKAKNINFVIITKAYASNTGTAALVTEAHTAIDVGDESVMLFKYANAKVIAAKKIKYAVDLIKSLKPEVIIVDDGMQNPGFYKDLTILTIDHDRGFGNGFLIPAGPLRQSPVSAFAASDIAVVVSASSTLPVSLPLPVESWRKIPVFTATITPVTIIDKTKTYFAFSSIGNPERFFNSLRNYGLKISYHKIFPDHHNYSANDLACLRLEAAKFDSVLITTMKDYVKVQDTLSVTCFDVELSIDTQERLIDLIYEKIFEKI